MTKTLQPSDLLTVIETLNARITKLEKSGPGTMTWTDPVSGLKIVIGTLSSGLFGIQVGNVTIKAVAGDITASDITLSNGVFANSLNTSGQNIQISISGTSIFFTTV